MYCDQTSLILHSNSASSGNNELFYNTTDQIKTSSLLECRPGAAGTVQVLRRQNRF
jgi:hypothetical protein